MVYFQVRLFSVSKANDANAIFTSGCGVNEIIP